MSKIVRKVSIKTTARPTSSGIRVTTSINNGHGTKTTSKTIRVK